MFFSWVSIKLHLHILWMQIVPWYQLLVCTYGPLQAAAVYVVGRKCLGVQSLQVWLKSPFDNLPSVKRCALPKNVCIASALVIELMKCIIYAFGVGVLCSFWVLDNTLLLLFSVSV